MKNSIKYNFFDNVEDTVEDLKNMKFLTREQAEYYAKNEPSTFYFIPQRLITEEIASAIGTSFHAGVFKTSVYSDLGYARFIRDKNLQRGLNLKIKSSS